MRFSTRLRPCTTLIDLTPLVDVIFLMLIFFLVTSEILPLKSLLIESPELKVDQPTKLSQLIVVMDQNHVIYLGSKKEIVDMGSIDKRLKLMISEVQKEYPEYDPVVTLHVDRRVDFDTFLQLFSQVRRSSSKVRLSFKEKDAK